MKLSYEGLRGSKKGLVVCMLWGEGSAVRYCEATIPWEDLAESEILTVGLERTVRRRLLEVWSGLPIGDQPLF